MTLAYREACLPAHLLSAARSAGEERSSSRSLLRRLRVKLAPAPADLLNGQVRIWQCEDDSQVVGHCAGDKSSGEIIMLGVSQGYEGLGIGRTLLATVVGWLRSEGTDRIWLVAPCAPTLRAFGFYRALGWRPTGESIDDDKEILALPAAATG